MTRAHELRTRKDYLQTLVDWDADPATKGMVRVISGVRRSGKSSLLELYKQHVGSEKVVSVNFEDFSTLGLREAQRFHEEMTARIAATGATHLHVDEVQELDDWSQVINSLRLHENLTITVTGSNASMFVGEGLTYLAGRYIQLEMFPLSLHGRILGVVAPLVLVSR
ncbi:ATP-binding protein [Corynebacterium striatum]|uniref:ATP-binding protein n=1 Tax=Corynebacterium striatum TaxID=43770 RepID=UPI003B5BA377